MFSMSLNERRFFRCRVYVQFWWFAVLVTLIFHEWWCGGFVIYTKNIYLFWHDLMECPGYKHLKHKRVFHTIPFRLSKSVTTVHLSGKWFYLQNEHFNTRDPVKNESVVKWRFRYPEWSWFIMNEQLSRATISSFNISENPSIFNLSVSNYPILT